MTHIAITNFETPVRQDGVIVQATGESGGDTTWPLNNWEHGDPGRHVVFQENWRGFNTWNTWQVSFNPPIRRQVAYGNAADMQNVLAARNPPSPGVPAPIPIGQYAVNTAQVNTGQGAGGSVRFRTDRHGGRVPVALEGGDWLSGIRRR
jgi:hypothetical protein